MRVPGARGISGAKRAEAPPSATIGAPIAAARNASAPVPIDGSMSPVVAAETSPNQLLFGLLRRALHAVAPNLPAGFLSQALLHRLVARGFFRGAAEDLSALERGLPGNVTTEMDLSLGDLTDLVRGHPALLDLLQTRRSSEALAAARSVEGGPAFLEAWRGFMARYGMRGPGEVDLSRPRYRDDPAPLISTILGSAGIDRAPGEHRARHAALTAAADAATARMLAATRAAFAGGLRARMLRRLVRVARNCVALREHPKFLLVRVLDLVRDAVREAGALLAQRGALAAADDVYLFRFEELIAALEAAAPPDLRSAAEERRATLRRDAQRSPPFVMSSDGEIPALAARTDLPPGALAGTAASATGA